MCGDCEELMEEGRRLASERDDLIADGIDPAELLIPLAPEYCRKIQDQH